MTPRATYRLQFNKDFGFSKAAEIAPYLGRLGVSHVYASPWLKARAGSSHGYNIVDHHALNPDLGTRSDFDAMIAAFRANGLLVILDTVPNHMGVGYADNPLWLDVLEWGVHSAYAGWFDIEWQPQRDYLKNKLLVPFLGNQYGVELYEGKLMLEFDAEEGSFAVWAYDTHKLPICPLQYGRILGDAHPDLERLSDSFLNLLEWRPEVPRRTYELKAELARLVRGDQDIRDEVEKRLRVFRGTHGQPETWQLLDALIQDQTWRAADFRVAADDINYRRFFNVNELAALRMEIPAVFDYAHSLTFQLLADGSVDGLRVDHVDGLLNPKEYLRHLRAHPASIGRTEPFYLVVEKIVARHESLPEDWPIDGTTGYEFANLVLGLLIDPKGEEPFTNLYADWTGERKSFRSVVRDCKLQIMRNEIGSELDVLADEAVRVAHQTPRTTDFTHYVLRRAIREVVASFPVYRTYIDWDGAPTADDRRDLTWAMKLARVNEPDLDPSVFDFVHALFSGDLLGSGRSGFSRHSVLRCAMKLQQFSGPVMAKGMEDTAFYRYNRFIALNEVGGDPEQFGVSISNFHRANQQRAKYWPHSMLATSTHDTKRGEDSRARLAVLSEISGEWSAQMQAWTRILRARHGDIGAAGAPDRNDEYFFYQLLIGTWPMELIGDREGLDKTTLDAYIDRLKQAMTKSVREAKVHSTWKSPNKTYEDAMASFIDSALDVQQSAAFFSAFLPFLERVARLGVQNSLVQTILKLTAPGVPDIYQGSELWNLSMVDPDNRRPVDYQLRCELLSHPSPEPSKGWLNGETKLFATNAVLRLRGMEADIFTNGEYNPLLATGQKAEHICAFERRVDQRSIMVAAARFPARRDADPDWCATAIPLPQNLQGRKLWNHMTGKPVSGDDVQIDASAILGDLPVAIITAVEGGNEV